MQNHSISQLCIDGEIITTQSDYECNVHDHHKAKKRLLVRYNLSEFINQPLSTNFRNCEFTIAITKKYQNEECPVFLNIQKTGTIYNEKKISYKNDNEKSYIIESKKYHWINIKSTSWQVAKNYCRRKHNGTLLTINSHEEYLGVLRACNIMNKNSYLGRIKINICSNPFIHIGLQVISSQIFEKILILTGGSQ